MGSSNSCMGMGSHSSRSGSGSRLSHTGKGTAMTKKSRLSFLICGASSASHTPSFQVLLFTYLSSTSMQVFELKDLESSMKGKDFIFTTWVFFKA